MDEQRTDPWVLKNCSGEVFIHPMNLGVGFVQVPHDRHSQTRTMPIKNRSLNHPRGLYENHLSLLKYFYVTEKYGEWIAGEAHSFTAPGNMCAPPWRERESKIM